jgi:enamine deaminase RidA (YjgF/YER057c/UK114 family)
MSKSGEGVVAARRQLVSSGGPFEARFGYSRAVRVGNHVAVAGTTAIKDGAPFAPGDAAAQTRFILEVIEQALAEAGAALGDVIRYRVFVTDIADYPAVGAELGRVFGAIRPAGTLVGNCTLINPDLRVEIEVDAIVGSASALTTRLAAPEPVILDQTSS